MFDKQALHHFAKKLRPINKWYFLIATAFFVILAIYGLRQNNLTAIQLRDEVVAADKANKDVEKKLRTLREYIYSHMNTDLSAGGSQQHPVQLKYRYDRLVAAEKKRTQQANESIYTTAQKVCEKRFPLGQAGASGGGRVACIENYVTNSGIKQKEIPQELYKFDFVSPRWSPDLAGWSIVLATISFLLFIIRFISEKWLARQLQKGD
jgi:hypothetical protein